MRLHLFLKISAVIVLISGLSLNCLCYEEIISAEEYQENAEYFSENISSYADNAILEKANEIFNSLNPVTIFQNVADSFKDSLRTFSSYIMSILALLILTSIFSNISQSFSQQNEIFDFVSILIFVLLTIKPISSCVDYTVECVNRLCVFMTSFIPCMSAVLVAGGSSGASTAGTLICSGAVTTLQILSSKLVVPGVKVCIGLCCVSTVSKSVNLSGITSFIKNGCMWLGGLIMTLFCGILALQTFLSTGADTLALRGIKFTAARFIPVAGGMVSESLKTVLAGVSLIRTVTGVCGIAFIVYLIIPPIATLVTFKLVLGICSVFSKTAILNTQSTYLDALNSTLNILLSILLCSSISFIIMLAIFMKTAVNI